jgi:hypothetical protein
MAFEDAQNHDGNKLANPVLQRESLIMGRSDFPLNSGRDAKISRRWIVCETALGV